jgi:hypothetical protein
MKRDKLRFARDFQTFVFNQQAQRQEAPPCPEDERPSPRRDEGAPASPGLAGQSAASAPRQLGGGPCGVRPDLRIMG